MGSKKSACLYLDKEILETAKQMGLNVSRVSENALVEAIKRLSGPKQETVLDSRPRVEGRDLNPGDRLHRQGDNDSILEKFYDFCRVDLGLAERTSKEYRRKMRRFFGAVNTRNGSIYSGLYPTNINFCGNVSCNQFTHYLYDFLFRQVDLESFS